MDRKYPIILFIRAGLYILAVLGPVFALASAFPFIRQLYWIFRVLPVEGHYLFFIPALFMGIPVIALAELLRVLVDIKNSLDEIAENTGVNFLQPNQNILPRE